MTAQDTPETIANGKTPVLRDDVSASAMDGTIIRGYRYRRKNTPNENTGSLAIAEQVPLLCIPSKTGNSREFHTFILAVLRLKAGARTIYTIDMRGRGRSDYADIDTYSALTEAEDLISFCDAMGLHHIDVLASGGGSMAALLVAPRRPGLIRSIVFNDGGPEQDGVGVARTKAIYQLMPEPANWDEAVDILQQAKGKNFPALSDKQWLEMAQTIFEETEGTLIRSHDKVFTGEESRIDFDERLPMYWIEFAMFKTKPVLIFRGKHSLLLTDTLVQKMKNIIPALQEFVVEGQGHMPMLGTRGLPKLITDFLNKQES